MTSPVATSAKEAPAKKEGGRSSSRATPVPQPVFATPALIQRKCACGGACPSCEEVKRKESTPIQTKLRVNAPGDAFEQEADRVADQVMRMPGSFAVGEPMTVTAAPVLQRKCCGHAGGENGPCDECDKKVELQRSATAPGPAPHSPPIVHDVLKEPGAPLDANTRAFFEPRFGHDFSKVRVHTNSHAADSAKAIKALAYTVGNHVVFGAGQYAPRTTEGGRLVAHELAHVLQQGSDYRVADCLRQFGEPEREADSTDVPPTVAGPTDGQGYPDAGGVGARVFPPITVFPSEPSFTNAQTTMARKPDPKLGRDEPLQLDRTLEPRSSLVKIDRKSVV